MRLRGAVAAALAMLGAACASGDPQPAAAPSPTAAADCATPREGGDREAAMLLTDVRVARHDGFDRTVFEFEAARDAGEATPYWSLRPVRPPLRRDGSGDPIEVAGVAHLGFVAWASGVDLSGAEFREVYTGPKRIEPPDTVTVRELAHAGDFENVLSWYVGLASAACFTVDELADPVRIVLDVRDGGDEAPYDVGD